MTVNVQGPDGSDFEFPDGTSEDVISGAISQHYGGPKNPSFFDMPRADRNVAKLVPSIGRVIEAFGAGVGEVWDPDRLGLSAESKQWLASKNVLPKDAKDFTDPMKPFMAFNEGILLPLITGLDIALRYPLAGYRGVQAAAYQVGEELGVPNLARDLVSIPDAFMGSPHPLGIPRVPLTEPQPFVKPQPIRPIEGSPQGNLARSVAAQTSLPEVDAVLNNPVTRTVIDNPVIDRSHDVPYMAGGSTPMEDPTIYIDRHVPREQTVVRVSDPTKTVKFDPADPWIVHENVEQHTMELLIKGGMSEQEAYRVAHFEYAEKAEQAWYRAHDIDQEAAEREQLSWLPRIQHENPENPPPNLYNKPYPHDSVAGAQRESVTEAKPTPEEIAQAARIIAGRADELATGGFTAFHGSPASFEKFNTATVYVADDQGFAERYRQPRGRDSAGPGNLYQVSVGASRDDFLNLDRPLSEQSEQVKAALAKVGTSFTAPERIASAATKMGGDVYTGVNHALSIDSARDALEVKGVGQDEFRKLLNSAEDGFLTSAGRFVDREEANRIAEAGAQINKRNPFYNQSHLASESLTHGEPANRLGMDVWDALRDNMGADAAAKKLRDAGIAGTSRAVGTYSVFDPNILQITHVNGQPILDAARDLGVLGPPKVSLTEGKPAEAAARATGGDGGAGKPPAGGGGAGGEAGPPQPTGNPWRDRFEHFVGKLETPEDVKQLIRESADEKGEFPVARQGDIPLAHVEAIAEAAGVEPGEVNQRGLGRLLKNDAEVRTAMQLMLQVTENVKAAARDVRADGSPENLIKLQEAIMRRDLAVEQVVGLRAEWGRTGNVFQEFLRDVKDQEGLSNFLKDKGRTPGDLRDIADAVDALDRSQAARVLNDLRTPTGWDKFMWYWVNALISGPVTHAKYGIANAAFAVYESAIVTPVAGVVGAVRRSLLGGNEGVFVGEAAARMWGLVAGTPDAIVAAAKAARTGLQTPLPGEIAQNILPKQNKGLAFQQKPIEGPIGTLIGIPSRGAAGIHSFFNFLGYRASLEAQAYRQAAKEGLKPADEAFWQRRQEAVSTPTKEMMDAAIEEGYRLTYINELSPAGKLMSRAIKSTKLGQLVMPFTHIPFNILSRGQEGTPAAFLTEETRADVFGRNGAVKQDMAVARLVAGSAVGAWAVNLVLNDRMTGYGPTDPKERAQWTATGHQPYSIRIGDEWVSFNRFGSLGTMLGLHANLAEAIPHLKPDSEELTKALVMTVHSTGRLLEDEVGMQGLAGLIDAINDPERKGTRFVSAFAGSLLPYSSALRQTASSMDPEMREVKSFVDGLRYYIPGVRQDLLPKRDWLGEPFTNAGYGGDLPIPGVSSIIQHRQAEANPIAEEMKRLDLHPAVPSDRVGGVKLPPKLYDQYQMTAGQFTRQVLSNWVAQPNWYQMPEVARAEVFRRSISAVRQQAGAMMMGMYPQIIQQGVQQRVDQINGVKPTKLQD